MQASKWGRTDLTSKRFISQVRFFLLLFFLQFGFGLPAAYALSTSCTTLSSLSTTSYGPLSFSAASFDNGETVTVSYTDDGGDTSGFPPLADHVLVQDTGLTNAYGYNYYSTSQVSGTHSFTITSTQLTATGLWMNISTGTHISAVSITCTGAVVAPTVANTSTSVTANSSNNAVTLSITGTATAVNVVTGPTHGTAILSGTSILYTPTAGYYGADSLTYTASNGGSTSTSATASITVTAAALALSPAAGTLASGTVGTAYSQTFTASGGTAPYSYSATGFPTGLILNTSTGALSGTPAAAGSYTPSVTVTDGNSTSVTTHYSLTVAAAGTSPVPVAADRTISVNAGQTIVINLTDGASGSPYTGATLVTTPLATQGTATISNTYMLTFAAAIQASGTLTLRYTLTNASGTSNTATLTIQIVSRPDPSKDAQVTGLISAQAQSAVQFANAQIRNFNDRLERLHNEQTRRSQLFNVSVSLPRNADNRDSQGNTSGGSNTTGVASGDAVAESKPGSLSRLGNDDLVIWTGGFVNFVTSDRDSVRLDHTMVGLSAGGDYRFLPGLVAGVGIGVGHDTSDVASSGTQSKGNAFSAALYGSYHPGPVYIDSLLGFSYLTFDSHRYVTDTGGFATGSRNGQQIFGALSTGYEFQEQRLMLAPYGRLQFSSTLLRHYTESGAGTYNLAYANQRLNTLAAVAGLRSQYGIPMAWGALRLTGRVEYSHALTGDSIAKLGYADVGNDTYTVTALGLNQNTLSASAGVEFMLPQGLTAGMTYQGTTSVDSSTRENALLLRLVWKY